MRAALILSACLLAACAVRAPDIHLSDQASKVVDQAAEGAAALTKDAIRTAAAGVYASAKARHLTLDHGPCLAEELVPGWALDIAHSPRQAIDDQPENQCASYREGRVKHFIELDPAGKFIRME